MSVNSFQEVSIRIYISDEIIVRLMVLKSSLRSSVFAHYDRALRLRRVSSVEHDIPHRWKKFVNAGKHITENKSAFHARILLCGSRCVKCPCGVSQIALWFIR